jgi:hypothetical protein
MAENIKTIMEFEGYIRTKLGEPKVKVELSRSQIETNLYDSIQLFREYASSRGNVFGYMVLDIIAGAQEYTLPANVMQIGISKRGIGSSGWVLAQLSGAAATDVLSLKSFDMVSFYMLNQWLHTLRLITPSPYKLAFNHNTKLLTIIPMPSHNDKLIIEVFRQAEIEDLLDERWIKDHVLAQSKITLADIRGKFQSLPGFNNAVSLNAETLRGEGVEEKKTLEDDLINSFKYSQPPLPLFHSV